VRARASAFQTAYTGADQDALWDLLSADSRRQLENDLEQLHATLEAIPQEDRNDALPVLGRTPTQILTEVDAGKAYLGLLLDSLAEDVRAAVGKLELASVEIGEDAQRATLDWRVPEDAEGAEAIDAQLAEELPQAAVLEDGSWRFVITAE
jgi:hypothetical protein